MSSYLYIFNSTKIIHVCTHIFIWTLSIMVAAAALLTNSSLKFESLDDIIEFSGSKLCIWDRVSDDFLQVHPNAAQVLDKLPLPGNPTLELLEFVKNSSARCDAAVVHFDAYNWIVNDPQYERFCGAVDILKDDVLMTFENGKAICDALLTLYCVFVLIYLFIFAVTTQNISSCHQFEFRRMGN